jgi:hypothetical protein
VAENRDSGVESAPGIEKTAATSPKRVLRASKCLERQNAHQGSGILQEARFYKLNFWGKGIATSLTRQAEVVALAFGLQTPTPTFNRTDDREGAGAI